MSASVKKIMNWFNIHHAVKLSSPSVLIKVAKQRHLIVSSTELTTMQ